MLTAAQLALILVHGPPRSNSALRSVSRIPGPRPWPGSTPIACREPRLPSI